MYKIFVAPYFHPIKEVVIVSTKLALLLRKRPKK